ncbi:hypothetical protein, partial [Pseudomonas aeruginosa]
MQQVARILAGQTFTPESNLAGLDEAPMTPAIPIRHDEDDDLIVTVRDSAGQLLYASSTNRQL